VDRSECGTKGLRIQTSLLPEPREGPFIQREVHMASPQPAYSPPPVDGDFYKIGNLLNERERALIKRVRQFTESVVAPVIEDYWARDAFPHEIIPKMAEVGIGGVGYQGYGAAGGSWLLNGFVAMELARVDSSVAIPACRQDRSICAVMRSRSSAGCRP
jgi:alkylation response protein AidB-like acyl-CoA dehydrogenase